VGVCECLSVCVCVCIIVRLWMSVSQAIVLFLLTCCIRPSFSCCIPSPTTPRALATTRPHPHLSAISTTLTQLTLPRPHHHTTSSTAIRLSQRSTQHSSPAHTTAVSVTVLTSIPLWSRAVHALQLLIASSLGDCCTHCRTLELRPPPV
jgi:hypothetical protein